LASKTAHKSIVFAVDTSYHYTYGKDGFLLLKVINTQPSNPQFKTIMYAVCSNEDHPACEHILQAVIIEVERVVNKRMDAGYTHI
jgi:hypothetical protein